MRTAWDLHRAFPEAEFVLNQTSGHSAAEPATTSVLVGFANKWPVEPPPSRSSNRESDKSARER